jgi:hypothetical protein
MPTSNRNISNKMKNLLIMLNLQPLKTQTLSNGVKIKMYKNGNIKTITTPYDKDLTINNPLK